MGADSTSWEHTVELRHLRYFIAAFEERSLQSAARRMHVAQPALSRQVRDLELELGSALFERKPQGVTPTEAGTAFYRDALKIVGELEDAVRRVRAMGQGSRPEIRVGIVQNARRYAFISKAIARFSAQSRTHIAFTRSISPDLLSQLREHRLDIAFLLGAAPPGALSSRLIHREQLVLAMPADHPLAIATPARVADLAGVPLVWLTVAGNDYHSTLESRLRAKGVEPVIAIRANSYEEMLDLTLASGGVCITSASTMMASPSALLKFRPIADLDLDVTLTMAWSAEGCGAEVDSLLQLLHAAVDNYQRDLNDGSNESATLMGCRVLAC